MAHRKCLSFLVPRPDKRRSRERQIHVCCVRAELIVSARLNSELSHKNLDGAAQPRPNSTIPVNGEVWTRKAFDQVSLPFQNMVRARSMLSLQQRCVILDPRGRRPPYQRLRMLCRARLDELSEGSGTVKNH